MARSVVTTLLFALAVQGCQEQSGSAPRNPDATSPVTSDAAVSDAPVRLEYVCGDRFLIVNTNRFAVTGTYRVQGTDEQGARTLPPAPAGDPPFSETELVTTNTGSVEFYIKGQLVQVRRNDGTACAPSGPAPSLAVAATSTVGKWTTPFSWPIVPVHLHLLRNGKVLAWGKFGDPYIWDPSGDSFTAVPAPSWLFCAGHTYLSDGRLLVAGGHISDDHGLPDANLFNASTVAWTAAAPMRNGRWYPTTTLMANGEVVTLAGRDQNGITVRVPEIWTGSGWRALTGAALTLPYYPRSFLAPNGQLFYAGEQQATRYLNTSGTGSWTFVANRLYGNRDYGAAVMYEPGKILYGGGGRTTNTAETIDLNVPSPTWKWTGSMAYRRRHLNATILPTGEVLVTGGSSGTDFNDPELGVHAAELWSPATGTWTTLASNAVNRSYHSTSILLLDGRVLHAGSGDALLADGTPAPAQNNAELFSPPYLFKGSRPTVSSSPSSVSYGGTFFVGTPSPAAISQMTLIALGSATHAFDMSQRFVRLTFTPATGGLNVAAPSNRNIAPPGYYMLFVLNGNNVPSVAKIIRLK